MRISDSKKKEEGEADNKTARDGRKHRQSGSIVIPVDEQAADGTNGAVRRSNGNRAGQMQADEPNASLRDRNSQMLFNELMADVHFVVGPPGSQVAAFHFSTRIG